LCEFALEIKNEQFDIAAHKKEPASSKRAVHQKLSSRGFFLVIKNKQFNIAAHSKEAASSKGAAHQKLSL